jgi:hypothetical protein
MATTQLGDLKVAIEDAAEELAEAFAAGTTFATLPADRLGPAAELVPKPLGLSGSDSLAAGPATLTLGAAGSYHISALTGTFTDADAIVTPAGGAAWLKQELDAQVSAQVSATASGIDFGLKANTEARLLDYRKFAATAAVAPAVLDDITRPRWPTSIKDLMMMAPGDAVAFVVTGNLAFSATYNYSELLSASIAALDNVLKVAGASAFTIAVGGSVAVDFGASDSFRIVFTRGTKLDLAVEVKKEESTNLAVNANLGLTAKLSNPQQLASLVVSYLEGRLGTPYQDYKALVARLQAVADMSGLSADEKAAVGKIVGILGWQSKLTQFQTLVADLAALPGKLQTDLQDALAKTLTATFTIGYSRVATGETLISFEATQTGLDPLLPALLAGNLSTVAARLAAQDPQLVLVNYLSTTVVTSTFSFGLSLAVGSWKLSSQTTITCKTSEQTNLPQQQLRVAYDSQQRFVSTLGKAGETFGMEIAAAMAGFAKPPSGASFAFSLSLGWTWDQDLTAGLTQELFDLANVWRVADPSATAALGASLAPLEGKRVHAEISLTVGDAGVRRLAIVPEPQYLAAWTQAMAEALPPVLFGNTLLRADIRQRAFLYLQTAQAAFDQHAPSQLGSFPDYSKAHPPLSAADADALRNVDRGQGPGNTVVYSLDNLWNPDTATVNPWQIYQRSVGRLRRLGAFLAGTAGYEDLPGIFTDIQIAISQDYTARLFGSLLGQVLGGPVGLISGSLTVTPTAGGSAVVIGGAAATAAT